MNKGGGWTVRNLALEYAPGHWVQDALCGQTDPELFFPEKGVSSARAKLVCRQCPVITQCRDFAVAAPMLLDGVWGGTTARERQELRRERGIRSRLPNVCGTPAGVRRHYRNKEVPCAACRRAAAQDRAERRKAANQ